MCQLLGMNCNTPTDICFSFEGFHTRGGLTDVHRDGWGIAFFEGAGCRLFLDSKATIESPVAELVRKYPIRSKNVIAHIRKATQGEVALENTHPFMRELWGRYWIFAHNGNLKDQDVTVDFSELTTPEDRVALIATAPLTDNEAWTPIAPGTLAMFVDGAPAAQAPAGAAE